MTVRGEGCMADTHDGSQTGGQSSATCNGHTDQHTGQRSAGSDRQTGAPSSGNTDPEADCRSRGRDSAESGASLRNSSRDSCLSRAAEVDDELPLGSEANTLRQAQGDGLAVHPPVDKRLWSLRGGGGGAGGGGGIGGGGGGGGGSQLLHSGWTSFNSDVSNLTSGSNQSASSVEWLLQERQVDPEQILLNLGFGGVLPSAPTTMYTRIPERFLHQESSATSADDDAFAEGSPAEAVPPGGRPMSRGMAGWHRARNMSTALMGLKLLTSIQQQPSASPLGPFFAPLGPSSLSSSSPTPPGRARSVLHPDNQRALAQQGFYGDQLPEGLEGVIVQEREETKSSGRKKSAEDRRKQFHKARSKRQHSLVESGEEEGGDSFSRDSFSRDSFSRDSHMKSVDFSTTTESTDSGGELSTSAPTTPGDVFLDRAGSPLPGISFPADRLADMDDLYQPGGKGRRSSRTRLSDGLDPDSDVTPCASRQPTMEKAPTLTPSQGDEEEEEEAGMGMGRSSGAEPKKTVSIVVSEDVRRHQQAPASSSSSSSSQPFSGLGGGGRGGMNFLNIVNAAVDRLSDSGSEHTLVDQHSSSSGSPRPATGSESPRLFPDSPRGDPAAASYAAAACGAGSQQRTRVIHGSEGPCEKVQSCGTVTRQLEPSPVVYKKDSDPSSSSSARDENDNLAPPPPPHSVSKQGHSLHPHLSYRRGLEEDLPRMSSVQSDSSGFVDAEASNENSAPDMASLKVSNLGSSCESSATMASTSTVVGSSYNNNSYNNYNNNNSSSSSGYKQANKSFQHHPQNYNTETTAHSLQESPNAHKRRSRSADDILNAESPGAATATIAAAEQRYITMCYIPHLNKPPSAQVSLGSIRDLLSSSYRDGRHSPRGPTHISVVLKGKGGKGEVRRDLRANEIPLSEELAQASSGRPVGRGSVAGSSAIPGGGFVYLQPRYSVSGPAGVSSIPRGVVARGNVETSSVDGSRGSGDELERDDRSLSYSSWSRELPSASSLRTRRLPGPRQYPGTDEESGSSVYSCASTSDSITSGSGSPLLDYHKLIKLINTPTVFKGRKTRMVQYRPRRHLRDWPGLMKKKRLQEEARLAQYALQKFKTEMNIMETAVMGRYTLAFEDLTQEERDDVEELQHLWAEVRQQAMETEHLLTSRMKSLASGNDSFNFLSSIAVLQRLIDLLKEQHFQKQLDAEEEEEEEEEGMEDWEVGRGGGRYGRWGSGPRYASLGSWGELPRPSPRVRGRYSSSTSHLPPSPAYSDSSYDQLRTSLVSEIRQEVRSNLHTLQQDLQKRDQEIHRLQLQLMLEGQSKMPRSSEHGSRSKPLSRSQPVSPRRRGLRETDV